ncbi:hypothetical protein [Akkermansia muciniphila]|uniref:hypothetical protein n=1 Tax=Akkermansia muciniphila TaxID=239935 RepID=UPI00319D93D5
MKFGADSLHLKTQNTYGTDHMPGVKSASLPVWCSMMRRKACIFSSSSRRNSTTPRPMTQP